MPAPTKLDAPEILAALFFPRQHKASDAPPNSSDLTIGVEEGVHLGCRLHYCLKEAPMLLFFHGNGETVADYDEVGPYYTASGLNFLVATYRGYGWSNGLPSASALVQDNHSILSAIISYREAQGFSGPLFVMGRSLGSVSAIDLAYRAADELKGLIIESGFGDTLPLAGRLGFAVDGQDISEADCFNNIAKIRQITMPTLILHGARDQLIPIAEAEKLQAESGAKAKQFQIIPGADHNSLISVAGERYFEAILTFIRTVTGENTWRKRRKRFKDSAE